ncbi:MAG: tRNA uridine-5-carboxymethylaminomethyl(34) synthesis GTPase MnmE [Bacteroides sp.]|nr:tRNA uridine-5-carboxymethylaminomethyl(34) synthesis GTPase MnmE [Bacteroides sp.]
MEQETIVAVASAPGTGGIAVIRLSGPEAFTIATKIWRGKNLAESEPYRARYGSIVNPENGEIVDDALATPFRGPASFTGENTVEFAVHGSRWIQREVVRLLIDAGARMADHGEFTQRAFLNGKLDLAQAEGVADLIASSSRAGHRLAISQTRGGFSRRLEELREKLIEFASLLELELDFSEEDVEFADRTRLRELADETLATVNRLADSYSAGRALKEGVPVVIAGVPNAGKSTLLNALLGDDKAIVSDIPGTTRDVIEDTAEIDGILFRFIDTAGLRDTADKVERLGIERTHRHIANAAILIRLLDATQPLPPQLQTLPTPIPNSPTDSNVGTSLRDVSPAKDSTTESFPTISPSESIAGTSLRDVSKLPQATPSYSKLPQATPTIITVINKSDLTSPQETSEITGATITISAKTGQGLKELEQALVTAATPHTEADLTVTNARHYEALKRASAALTRAAESLQTTLSADFIAQDIREALHHLGAITGAITTPDLLHSIFARFCIGK